MTDLYARLDDLARTPLLLVATDFDGTLAPIVNDPARAEADREALVALRALAQLPQTHVAVISGRALGDLAGKLLDAERVHLVGSHGSEFEAGLIVDLSPAARATLERLSDELRTLAARCPGTTVETKPAALAFHYRNAEPAVAQRALEALHAGPAAWPGVFVREGKMVVELSVIETHKGAALARLRQRLGASAVVFAGDDQTDEDAFATLAGPDLGVKVGPGDTRAAFRVDAPIDVARLLARLVESRSAWLAGAGAVPIERHSLLSDQRTVAIVDPHARVVWLCLPRIDSPAVFAELLGGPVAGFFEIRPAGERAVARQTYVGDSFILQTRWPQLVVTDYLDCGGGRAFQRAGRSDLVRVVEGRGRVRLTFSPRLDFGRIDTRLRVHPGGIEVEGALDPLVLASPGVPWRILDDGQHQTAVADVELGDAPLELELRHGTASLDPLASPEAARRRQTERFWSAWAATLTIPPIHPHLVRRSALVLKALCHGPTGAFAAAATTSLPEHAGGVRNWDYRYCWPRDAALAASALIRLGAPGPAIKFLDWVLGILDEQEESGLVRPVYTVRGRHLGAEGEISHLAGYRGSRPVRVGNAAAGQVQLDVFGPIAEVTALLAEHGAPLSSEHWRMIERMVGAVRQHWREPDHGIWEARRPRCHHVHSKVMCWQTVDRALAVARYMGKTPRDWNALRDAIADDVLRGGWHEAGGAFGATYDDPAPDAALLAIGLSGLLSVDDPRFLATVERIERALRDGALVYRYRYDDGLPGREGAFLLCSAWLIEVLALVGRRDEAVAMLDGLAALAGPTGLLSEEYDPHERMALGNYPQAYSHIGLINAAVRLAATASRPAIDPAAAPATNPAAASTTGRGGNPT